jgi:transposase
MSQLELGFAAAEPRLERPRKVLEGELFLDPEPEPIEVGGQRLDSYLCAVGQQWVVQLAGLLAELDYAPFTPAYKRHGRKALHPQVMLGLIVYGIVKGRWSLRELEGLAAVDVGAWWVCGNYRPDHSTVGKFIQLHRELLSEEFFTALVKHLLRKLKLGAGTVAGDGTVIEAVASHYRALRAEAARQAAQETMAQAAQAPADADLQQAAAQAGEVLRVTEQRLAERQGRGSDQGAVLIVRHELEAVVQRGKDGRNRPSFKPSILVHQAGLIVGQGVESSSEVAALEGLLAQHAQGVGAAPQRLLLDAGYLTLEVLSLAVERELDLLCPSGKGLRPKRAPRHGRFPKAAFSYDSEPNRYRCPAGRELPYLDSGADRWGRRYRRYRGVQCDTCALRAGCTNSPKGRTIRRYPGDELKELMAQILSHPAARRQYRRRCAIVEPVFGHLRERQGLKRFHRRGLRGARVEFALHCLAFNLRRVLRRPLLMIFFTAWLCAPGRPPRLLFVIRITSAL